MSHSLIKIWIHGIFGTKDHRPLIRKDFENQLHQHIKEQFENEVDCKVRIINGIEDHVHVLFLMSANQTISNVFKITKGESSHWCNQMGFTSGNFGWQIGYGAFSVSESMVKEVEQYIRNQKEHHKKMSYEDEIKLYIKKYGLVVVSR